MTTEGTRVHSVGGQRAGLRQEKTFREVCCFLSFCPGRSLCVRAQLGAATRQGPHGGVGGSPLLWPACSVASLPRVGSLGGAASPSLTVTDIDRV